MSLQRDSFDDGYVLTCCWGATATLRRLVAQCKTGRLYALLTGLLRNIATVSGCAGLHKMGGNPRMINSASAATIFPICLIAPGSAPA